MRPIVLVWISLCLMLCCTSCTSSPVRLEVKKQYPPKALTESTLVPSIGGDTFRDLLMWSVELHGALDACNQDKASLRDWATPQEEH